MPLQALSNLGLHLSILISVNATSLLLVWPKEYILSFYILISFFKHLSLGWSEQETNMSVYMTSGKSVLVELYEVKLILPNLGSRFARSNLKIESYPLESDTLSLLREWIAVWLRTGDRVD